MAEEKYFHYKPRCSDPNCDQPAVYKVGAVWSDGTSRELKNYGLTCEAHRQSQLERARKHRDGLRLADGESVGQVALFVLDADRRDRDLARVNDVPG
jgi:hypothetical protein